jgi:hypothetical protein
MPLGKNHAGPRTLNQGEKEELLNIKQRHIRASTAERTEAKKTRAT